MKKKEMLINVLQPEECRIAIVEDGALEELYVERTSHESYVGNIYKGRIVNIEPSIQAAFVDFGVGRNGFLHVSDVEPAYYRHLEQRRSERENGTPGRRGGRGEGRSEGRGEGRRRRREEVEDVEEQLSFASADALFEDEPTGQTTFGEDVLEAAEEEAYEESEAPEPVTRLEIAAEEVQAFKEEAAVPPSPAPSPAPGDEAAAPGEDASLTALPETRIEVEEPARGRRRSRSGTRKRTPRGRSGEEKGKAAGEDAETPAGPAGESESPPETPSAAGGEPQAEGGPAEGESGDEDRPQWMGSAEHRTTGREGPEEGGSREPLEPTGADDDLLFFPRSEEEEEPEEPEEERYEEESFEEPEEPEEQEEPLPPPAPVARLPRTAPPARLEDALEEDLSAAEIGTELPPEYAATFADEGEEWEGNPPAYAAEPQRREGGRDDRRRGGGRDRDRDRGDRGPRGQQQRRRGGGRPGTGRPKPLIQDIFRRGQEVLVQVIKEGIGTKGPTLSTYISIAGRYLVLMPGLNRVGVSRKIDDEEQRRRLREIFNELKPPRGLGFIIRTAGIDRNKKELQRDLAYLSRLWQVVIRRIRKVKSPAEIYQESDMITRTIRDTFTSDIDTIWVDEPNAYEHAREFLQIVMPRYANRIKLYDGKEPMFHKYGIEEEIARINQKKVPLPAGGSIVIEQTEALVSIDVNSGSFRADNNAEETAYQMNLQAAREIARQLRLRDLGGVIVNDFIDMREEKHRRAVEKAVRDAVKRDRARTKILKMSAFGIIEMTRQRIRPSLKRSVYEDCPYCHGMGQVKTTESMSLEVMRLLQLASCRAQVQRVEVHVTDEVADYLLNKRRGDIARLEEAGNIQVVITGTAGAPPETLEFICYDNNNNEVKLFGSEPTRVRR